MPSAQCVLAFVIAGETAETMCARNCAHACFRASGLSTKGQSAAPTRLTAVCVVVSSRRCNGKTQTRGGGG